MSEERETTRVMLLDSWDSDGPFPERLVDMLAWAAGLLLEAPVEYREQVTVCVETGEYSTHFEIFYDRPETDEEMAKRVQSEMAWEQSRESRERAAYERLKAKFG